MRRKNRGMTMVEILVAFVMLTLVMGISYSSIRFATNLTKEAADVDRRNERFESFVADYFRDEDHYKVASDNVITYDFQVVNPDGSTNEPYTTKVKKAKKTFKYDGVKYIEASDDSDENARNIFFFSTDD